MKKLTLAVWAAFFSIIQAFAQQKDDNVGLTVENYEQRKLKIEEVNFVTSYYHQDGNNSAVTGGLGSELLTDFSNTLDLRLSKTTKKGRKHDFGFEMGFDHYTSASSDMIDNTTISSASSNDQRYYPSLFWSVSNPEKGKTFGANVSYSTEWDYQSYGGGLTFSKAFNNNNTEITLKANAFFDKWAMILPAELRPIGYPSGAGRTKSRLPYNPRNSFNFSVSLAQVVSERLQVALIAEPNYQKGQLATPYQRVHFSTTDSVRTERLPDTRWKLPIGLRANYFAGDKVVVRSFYRFYIDQWGLTAHTLELEAPIKINPFLSLTPNYRFYAQNGISYFGAINTISLNEQFYTSDYDLSKFRSHAAGLGIRWKPLNGVFGMSHWTKVELRYLHYNRSTSLSSNIVSLLMSFK